MSGEDDQLALLEALLEASSEPDTRRGPPLAGRASF
jgi:hypothetical protein